MAKQLPMARPVQRPRPPYLLGPPITVQRPISQGRPSVNLGHVFNSSINPLAHLHSGIGNSNPIPYNILNPRNRVHTPATPVNNLGHRISTAISAVARPNAGRLTFVPISAIPFSVRIRNAINQVRNG